MKFALELIGTLIAMLIVFLFVGFTITYALIFINFSGPESVVEPCFEIGFGVGLVCALTLGFFLCRHFWIEYAASEPE